MPINLGSAVFNLAINSTAFVSKMASAGSSVAGFAAKTTKGMNESAKSYATFSRQSAELDQKIKQQQKTVDSLTNTIQAQGKIVSDTNNIWKAQVSVVQQATLDVKNQKDAVELLMKSQVSWEKTRTATLVATGMAQAAAAQQAQADYQAELSAQNATIASLRQVEKAHHDVANTAHQTYVAATIDLTRYTAAISTEQIKLNQFADRKQGLGPEPKAPSGVATVGAGMNEMATRIAASSAATSAWVGNASKGMERITRGLRGVNNEWAAQKEKVYEAERAIASHKARIDQAAQAVESYGAKFEQASANEAKRTTQINAAYALEAEKIANIGKEQAKLQDLMDDGASAEVITHQTTKIERLTKELERHRGEIQKQLVYQKQDYDVRSELEKKYASAQAYLSKVKDAQTKHNLSLKEAKEDLKKLGEEQKAKSEKDKVAKKTQDDLTKAMDENGKKAGFLASLWARIFGSGGIKGVDQAKNQMDGLSQSTEKASGWTEKLRLGFSTMIGAGIGSFLGTIAGNMQQAAGSALVVYKNNELMQLSLKNMIAAQLLNQGKASEMVEAQAMAVGRAQELDKWMKQLALNSPFSQNDIKDSLQLGLSLGFTVEQTQRLAQATTNWAAANGKSGEEMTQVTRAMGQMNSNQRVTLEDLNQLTNVGIGWADVLEKEFGPEIKASGKSLRDLISAGVVPADRAIAALTERFEGDFKDGAKEAGNSVTGLLASLGDIKDSVLQAGFEALFDALKPLLQAFTQFFIEGDIIPRIREFGSVLGDYVGAAIEYVSNLMPTIVSIWNDFAPAIWEAISGLSEFAAYTYDWGAGIINEFAAGIMDNVQPIIDAVMEIGSVLTEWLMPHSPPKILPSIDVWGTKTMQEYINGMSKADMTVISNVGDQVRNILGANGQEGGIATAVIGTQDVMARAIAEFNRIGSVSEQTFAQLRNAAGSAGDKVESYARAMFDAQSATNKVASAQNNLNNITKKYDAILAPLNAKLAAFQNKQEGKAIADEVKALQEQLAFKNPEGMDFDKSGILARLEELDIQKQINEAELARDQELGKAEIVLTAAQEEQKKKEETLSLIEQQIEFENKKKNLIREQTEELEKQNEEMEKASEISDKAEKDALKLSDAQFKAALAQATSAEKVELLTEKLETLEPGTIDYIKTQQELVKAQDAYNKELEKTAEAQEKLDLSSATAEERVTKLQDKLSTLTPGTLEYIKTQQDLEKAQDALTKSTNKLSDAEFAAQLAGMTRAEQIEALQSRLKGLDEGSLEYFNTQKKLNGLELAEQKSLDKKGGAGGKPKGAMLGGRDFTGLKDDIKDTTEPIKEVGKTLNEVSKNAKGYAEAIRGFFARLRVYGEMFGYIISRFAAGVVFMIAMRKIVQPIMLMLTNIAKFFTPINVLFLALVGIGYVIREDIGGIQGIVSRAYADIMPLVTNIKLFVDGIIAAFKTGNVAGIIQTITGNVPLILGEIGKIGLRIAQGVQEWAGPLLSTLFTVFRDVFTSVFTDIGGWMKEGGPGGLFENIMANFNNGFDKLGMWLQTFGVAYLISGFGLIYSIIGDQIIKNIPMLQEKFNAWKKVFVEWMLEVFPRIMNTVGIIIGGLAAALVKGAISVLPVLLKIGLEWVNTIATMVPGIVRALTAAIITFGVWLSTDGIVTIVKGAAQIGLVILNWLATTGPTFLYEVGQMLGDTFSKLIGGLVAIIAYWVTQGIPLIRQAVTWIMDEGGPALERALNMFKTSMLPMVAGIFTGIFSPIIDIMAGMTSDAVNNAMESFGVALDAGKLATIKRWVDFWDSLVKALKSYLGIASPSTVFIEIGQQVIQGAIDGAVSLIQELIDLFTNSWNTIYTNVTGAVTNIVTEGTLKWQKFQKDFIDAADDLKRLIPIAIAVLQSKVVAAIRTMVEDGFAKIKQFRDDATTAFDEVSTRIVGAVGSARDTIGTILEELVGKVGTAFDNLKKFFSDKNFRDEVVADAKTIGTSIIDGVIAGFRGGFETLKNALLSFLKETVGKMLDEWKENFFGSWKPDPPKASGGGTQTATGGGSTSEMVAGGGMTTTSFGDRGTTTTPGATATAAPPKWNWRMVSALWDASKNKKALPRGLGTPTKYDLAEFVRQGGKLNRGFVAAMNNPLRYSMAGSGRENDPWRIEERLDLDKRWKEVEEMAAIDPNAGLTASSNAMLASQSANGVSSGDTVTNNYNATFQTVRDSTGLMNDFNIMKALRKV